MELREVGEEGWGGSACSNVLKHARNFLKDEGEVKGCSKAEVEENDSKRWELMPENYLITGWKRDGGVSPECRI